jgi:hypothetical protein
MREIFGFEPGEYLIRDLSSLQDFVGVDDLEFVDILAKIRNVYGLDVADLPSENLLEIFRKLHQHGTHTCPGHMPIPNADRAIIAIEKRRRTC